MNELPILRIKLVRGAAIILNKFTLKSLRCNWVICNGEMNFVKFIVLKV